MREEGGTPDIVGSIRAGLVFQLKQVCLRVNLVSMLLEVVLLLSSLQRFGFCPLNVIVVEKWCTESSATIPDNAIGWSTLVVGWSIEE